MKHLHERIRDRLRRNLDTNGISELCVMALQAADRLEDNEKVIEALRAGRERADDIKLSNTEAYEELDRCIMRALIILDGEDTDDQREPLPATTARMG